MKSLLLISTNKILSQFGWKLQSIRKSNFHDLPPMSSHEQFVDFISDFLELKYIWDIGSHKGWWSQKIQKILPDAHFTLIDAVEHEILDMDFRYVRVIKKLLSDRKKQVLFYQTNGTGDSYYKELWKDYSLQESKLMVTATLDETALDYNLEFPDLVKFDTQGSELDIIQGGADSLANCKVIICEVPFYAYNASAPNFKDYIEKFESMNLLAVSILEVHKLENHIIQLDVGFVRSDILEKYM
jgi:FkbM family methyltransferase